MLREKTFVYRHSKSSLSLIALSAVDAEKLRSAVSAMLFLFVGLIGSILIIDKTIWKPCNHTSFGILQVSLGMIGIAVAVSMLTMALKSLASIDTKNLIAGLISVLSLIGGLILFLKFADFSAINVKQTMGLIVISLALNLLAAAVKQFSALDTVSLIKGLLSVVTMLAAFAGFSQIVAESVDLLSLAISFALISFSLMSFAKAVGALGELSISTIGKGLLAIAAGLAIIGTAVHFMPINLKSVGVGLVIVSAALYILAKALNQFADTSWEYFIPRRKNKPYAGRT